MIATTKVQNNVNEYSRLQFQYRDITAIADYKDGYVEEFFNETTQEWDERYVDPTYTISYHKGLMPAFQTDTFESIEELAKEMKRISGDLRVWTISDES